MRGTGRRRARRPTVVAGLVLAVLSALGLPAPGPASAHPAIAASGAGAGADASTATPVVTDLAPRTGTTAGGTVVTVAGTGLADATGVRFGPTPAASFTVVSDVRIDAVAPAGVSGTPHTVWVTTPDGTSPAGPDAWFWYRADHPSITAVEPRTGPLAGGTVATLHGSGFTGATAVTFGAGNPSPSVTVSPDGRRIDAVVPPSPNPASASTLVLVRVEGPSGASDARPAAWFHYRSTTTVTAVAPRRLPTTGDVAVVVHGSGFTGATAVRFGAIPATSFTVVGDGRIDAVAPAGAAGAVDVVVDGPGGPSATGTASRVTYTSFGPPVIDAITPSFGPAGTVVRIQGRDLLGGATVRFGSTPATSVLVVDDGTLLATAPPLPECATVNVAVTTAAGTTSSAPRSWFLHTAEPEPTIATVRPAVGPTTGGTAITVTGTGFTGATAVELNTTPVASFTVVDDTTITAVTAAAPAGRVAVAVRTPCRRGAGAAFEYRLAGAPVVTALAPRNGPATGGTVVTLRGSGLSGATAVRFGPTPATSFTVVDDTTITAVAPPRPTGGLVQVIVENGVGPSNALPVTTYAYQ